jgi:hypothetical protein
MPLKNCSANGTTGWKWGDSGHCYTGKNGKKKAIKQGLAVEGVENFAAKAGLEVTQDEIDDVLAEMEEASLEIENYFSNAYISVKERDSISTEDFGWPEEKKYPIRNQKELNSAAKLIGRAPADKQASIKSRIKTIAKRKGLTLPESWK